MVKPEPDMHGYIRGSLHIVRALTYILTLALGIAIGVAIAPIH